MNSAKVLLSQLVFDERGIDHLLHLGGFCDTEAQARNGNVKLICYTQEEESTSQIRGTNFSFTVTPCKGIPTCQAITTDITDVGALLTSFNLFEGEDSGTHIPQFDFTFFAKGLVKLISKE